MQQIANKEIKNFALGQGYEFVVTDKVYGTQMISRVTAMDKR